MYEEDYLYLTYLVEARLREQGLGHIADEKNYIEAHMAEDDESARLLPPKEHLIALLRAFDVHLVLHDSSVAKRALARISRVCEGQGPSGAVLVRATRRQTARKDDLADLPNLSKIRRELRSLIQQLCDPPDSSELAQEVEQ